MGLAERFGARVTLLHVVDLSLGALAGLPPEVAAMPATIELAERVRADVQAQMGELAARFPEAVPMIREGTARTAIVEVFFGSVAEHVVRHSPVPVLTVRQTDAP
jgi:nucleotide-binding universal stress UspA family protein